MNTPNDGFGVGDFDSTNDIDGLISILGRQVAPDPKKTEFVGTCLVLAAHVDQLGSSLIASHPSFSSHKNGPVYKNVTSYLHDRPVVGGFGVYNPGSLIKDEVEEDIDVCISGLGDDVLEELSGEPVSLCKNVGDSLRVSLEAVNFVVRNTLHELECTEGCMDAVDELFDFWRYMEQGTESQCLKFFDGVGRFAKAGYELQLKASVLRAQMGGYLLNVLANSEEFMVGVGAKTISGIRDEFSKTLMNRSHGGGYNLSYVPIALCAPLDGQIAEGVLTTVRKFYSRV